MRRSSFFVGTKKLREKYPDAGLYAALLKTEFIDNVLMDKDKKLRKLIPDEGLILNYFKVNLKDVSHKDIFYTSSVTVPKKILEQKKSIRICIAYPGIEKGEEQGY